MKTPGLTGLIFMSVIVVFVGFGGVEQIQAEQVTDQTGNTINFQWAFCVIRKSNGSKLEPVTHDTILRSGDQIKFFLKTGDNIFAYLIYRSSQGELSALFPFRFKESTDGYDLSGSHYIPQGDQWFELDENLGQEKFYLLVSNRRLNDLETKINEYESADPAKKPALAANILSQIHDLRRKYLKFKTYAERPLSIIGNMRGTEKTDAANTYDVSDFAVEITAGTFYSRTFTIDHQ